VSPSIELNWDFALPGREDGLLEGVAVIIFCGRYFELKRVLLSIGYDGSKTALLDQS
jgi:hypothetical protein